MMREEFCSFNRLYIIEDMCYNHVKYVGGFMDEETEEKCRI